MVTTTKQTIENDIDAAYEARFQAQCFLMRNLSMGLTGGGTKFSVNNPVGAYKNFFKIKTPPSGDIYELVSKITNVSGAEELFKITSKELAHMQPMIRLFKVIGESTEKDRVVEFLFSEGSFTAGSSPVSIFADMSGRGQDVGIESVNFELLASQPAEISNNIRCTLKIFFQNLTSLTKKRTSPDGEEYTYSDLIVRPPGRGNETRYHAEDYRIKLMVGWARPNTADISTNLKDILHSTQTTLNLTLKNHTFDFRIDGTASLEIEYHAWVEGALSAPETDLLIPDAEDKKRQDQINASLERSQTDRQKRLEQTGQSPGSPGTNPDSSSTEDIDESIKSQQEARNRINSTLRAKTYRKILDRFFDPDDQGATIFFMDVDLSQVGRHGRTPAAGQHAAAVAGQGPQGSQKIRDESQSSQAKNCADLIANYNKIVGTQGEMVTSTTRSGEVDEAVDQIAKQGTTEWVVDDQTREESSQKATEALKKLKPGLSPLDATKVRVMYFFFGDLLEACYDVLNESSDYKKSPVSKVRLLVGPMSIVNPCDLSISAAISIADIPISLHLFQAWFVKKVISPQRDSYLLRNLINDLIGELLPAAMGEQCVDSESKVFTSINTQAMSVQLSGLKPNLTGGSVKVDDITPVSAAWLKTADAPVYDFLLLYARGHRSGALSGQRMDDLRKGIYYFTLGSDSGIIKGLTFEKNDAPFLGEAKVIGTNNIANDLGGGSIYNFNAELVGNSLFVPGQLIYVQSRPLGLGDPRDQNSVASRIRLGGYYQVDKVESTLANGNFTTNISAIWTSSGNEPKTENVTPKSATEKKPSETEKQGLLAPEGEQDAGAEVPPPPKSELLSPPGGLDIL